MVCVKYKKEQNIYFNMKLSFKGLVWYKYVVNRVLIMSFWFE